MGGCRPPRRDRARTLAAWTTAVQHASALQHRVPESLRGRHLSLVQLPRRAGVELDGSVREWVGICLNVPARAAMANRACWHPNRRSPISRIARSPPRRVRAARAWSACRKRSSPRWRGGFRSRPIVRLEDAEFARPPAPRHGDGRAPRPGAGGRRLHLRRERQDGRREALSPRTPPASALTPRRGRA